MQGMGSRVVAPDGSVSTTFAFTASWPSRYTVAVISNSSSTTDFAGRLPPSTDGKTSATGMRPRALAPEVGGTVLGGSATFFVAGRRAGARFAAGALTAGALTAGALTVGVFAVASVTPGTVPKRVESALGGSGVAG